MASKDVKWLNPREMKAWRSYVTTARRLAEAMQDDIAGHDLSLADYEVLVLLSEAKDRMLRMSELADSAMLSKSRLSHRLKVMEKAGWVERQKCKEDGRGFWAVMTDKGWKTIQKAAPDHLISIRTRFVDHLTSKDQEDIARIFDRVHGQLRGQFEAEEK